MKAIWKDAMVAESDAIIVVEGNHHFPPDSIHKEYFRETDQHSVCPWKGTASYYDAVVGDTVNGAAAWTYPEPKEAAKQIAGYVAFWNGVKVKK